MTKTIIVEEECALLNKTGIGQYTIIVKKALNELNLNYKNFSKNFLKTFSFNSYIKNFAYIFWYNFFFIFKLLMIKGEIILISTNFFLPFVKLKKCKYITVIHDIRLFLYPNQATKIGRALFFKRFYNAIKKADIIITVSDTVKKELLKYFNINSDKIKVVYNSISSNFINFKVDKSFINKYNLSEKKYILSVATLNQNKNIPKLIKAFESISNKYPELKLVLVGGMGNEDREKLTKHPNIIFTGYIPDEDIPPLYKNALLYVFPSLYEGFGIPIIEAQYSECPILCSDIPVFREVAGDGAEFCKPDEASIAQKLEYLISNEVRRKELIQLGKINVKRFSIQTITKQLLDVLKS